MRLILPSFLFAILAAPAAWAQSVSDNMPDYVPPPALAAPSQGQPQSQPPSVYVAPDAMPPAAAPAPSVPAAPPADPYTVTDVNADVTADSAAHARDQALTQAEHAAFQQLCARMNAPDSAAKLNDDAVAAMVQSFEVQSERLSSVRYIGVFTIRFKPGAVQRKLGKYALSMPDAGGAGGGEDYKPAMAGPTAHMQIAVETPSLAAWAQIKRRLNAVPQVTRIDTIDLGRGLSHIDIGYGGSIDDLENAVTNQGFVLRQDPSGEWYLTDGSMVPR